MANNNVMVLTGYCDEVEFSHETKGEKFFKFTLGSERKSGTYDYVPCVASEIIAKQIGADKYKLTGEVRTRTRKEVNGTTHHDMYMFVASVEPCEEKENINQVEFTGNICKLPVLRSTPLTNKAIADVSIAVNRPYGSSYLHCIAWGRFAMRLQYEGRIGNTLSVKARFQSRGYVKHYEDGTTADMTAYELSIVEYEEGNPNENAF